MLVSVSRLSSRRSLDRAGLDRGTYNNPTMREITTVQAGAAEEKRHDLSDHTARFRARCGGGSAARAAGRCAQARFPFAAGPDRHRLSARRRHRHPGAADGAEDVRAARPAGDGREPAGRQRADRDARASRRPSRRPHHPVRHHRQPRGQSGAVCRQARHGHGARFHAAVAGRLARLRAGGQSRGAGEVAQGADRTRQGQARARCCSAQAATAACRICPANC